MPLIAVNLSDKLIKEIRQIVDLGRYATLESFIEIGAFNQLALERGASPAEIVERGHRGSILSDAPTTPVSQTKSNSPSSKSKSVKTLKKASPAEKPSKVDVVDPVTADEAKIVYSRFVRIPMSEAVPIRLPGKATGGDRIFGQVNRLFPVKLVCRWLATVAANEGQWPKYTAVIARLADDAGTIGSMLDDWDKNQKRERGGELATALPRRKNNASLDRFISQFVARITRASEISPGAVCQYEFARFNDSILALTEQGVAFAALENPILDAHDENANAALSLNETDFLVTHICTWVSTEWADMRTVLRAVQAGKASPGEVAAFVRAELPEEWTDSMVQTHVSGVIARLGDIRLLRRTWQGRNVQYHLGNESLVTTFLGSDPEGRS